MLDNLEIKKVGENTELSFVITNFGLGAPLTINNMEIVVCDKANNIINIDTAKNYYVSSYDNKKLVTYVQQKITFTIKGDIAGKAIGVKLSIFTLFKVSITTRSRSFISSGNNGFSIISITNP